MDRLSRTALLSPVLLLLFIAASSVPASAEGIFAANETGDITQSFYDNETAYVTGNMTGSNEYVDIYIVNHQTNWPNGTVLYNLSLGYKIVQANFSGGINTTVLWETPDVGSYDIIADIDRDAVYNSTIDYVDNVSVAGFTVLEAPKPTLTVVLGDNTPDSHNCDLETEREHNTMMQMNITVNLEDDIYIDSMAISAAGSGDDEEDIMVVYLVYDVNDNGTYDSLDALVSYGSYLHDDGAIFFDMGDGFSIEDGQTRAFIITYTMDTTGSLDDTYKFDLITVTAHAKNTGNAAIINGLPLGSAIKTISNEVSFATTTTTTTTVPEDECREDSDCGGTSCIVKARTTYRCVLNSETGLNECVETSVDVGCCYDGDCESGYYCIDYECEKEVPGGFLGLSDITWAVISIVVVVIVVAAVFFLIKNRKRGSPVRTSGGGEDDEWGVLKKKWEENK